MWLWEFNGITRLLGKKAVTILDNVLKSRDITLLTKAHLVKAMIFPVVMYKCESWTMKKAEHQIVDAFELCWRGLFESSLDSKEIKLFSPKGSQPWIFTGSTVAEAKAPILRSTDVKNWLIGKDPDAGKDWRQKEKREERMRWLDNITDSMDLNLSKLLEIVEDRGAWHAAIHGLQRVGHDWVTELNWLIGQE